MSEKQALYLVGNQVVLDNFTGLTIDGEDYTGKADKVALSRIKPLYEYAVMAYKEELPIRLLYRKISGQNECVQSIPDID